MRPLRSSFPPRHILNSAFAYTPAHATDVAGTIALARARIAAQKHRECDDTAKVLDIFDRRREGER